MTSTSRRNLLTLGRSLPNFLLPCPLSSRAPGTVSRWTEDTIFLIERLITKSPVILVGSGVGGWISLLVASKRPDLVAGLVTVRRGGEGGREGGREGGKEGGRKEISAARGD